MTAKRKSPRKKPPPIALRWLAAVQDCGDLPHECPSPQAVVAVAAVLMRYADPDGRNCYPAIGTVVRKARASKRTVVLVIDWLVGHGWLEVTRKLTRRPTVYRLTLAVGADEHPAAASPKVPTSTHENGSSDGSVGAVVGALVGADEHHDLLPPYEVREEEEGAVAPRPFGRGAAPTVIDQAESLFDFEVERICAVIAERVDAVIDPRPRLGRALREAMTRMGGSGHVIETYCVEKVERFKPRDPTAFLVTDLTTRVVDGIKPSARMQLADYLDRLYAIASTMSGRNRRDSPIAQLQSTLEEAELIDDVDEEDVDHPFPPHALDFPRRAVRPAIDFAIVFVAEHEERTATPPLNLFSDGGR